MDLGYRFAPTLVKERLNPAILEALRTSYSGARRSPSAYRWWSTQVTPKAVAGTSTCILLRRSQEAHL